MKKIIAKITGMMKYFKYLGKLIQSLKVLTSIIPSILILVPEDKKESLNQLVEALEKITAAVEKAEKFLNEFGIDTSIEDERAPAGTKEDFDLAAKKIEASVRGL